ncbi:hypothetical protein LSH36_675g00002 [Paralvinella palmiformis]|uniref:G-protein coupled receptors family 1 profile domain-containing protein n=1 Tax=Paralvinella palmiformis TaxID=53620 RepID=A0AAD9J2S5_9ANNE|nr:hypothetical protein LSH36_675g00002 [Paralvinella palmiformis]
MDVVANWSDANLTGFGDGNASFPNPAFITFFAAQEQVRNVILGFSMATFVFGFTGNSLVIYIIGHFSAARMKSVANYYIWSLAFADELFVLSLPMFCWATFANQWPITGVLGDISCKIAYACRDITKFASAWTMVALSVDRLLASYYNLGNLRTIRAGKIVCFSIWLACALVSLHYFVHAKTVANSCHLDNDSYGWFWTIMQLLLSLVLPSIGIFIPYLILSRRMRYRMLNRSGSSASSRNSPSRCMNRTVFVVVTAFTLCQTPYHVVQIISKATLSKTSHASLSHVQRLMYANAVSQILVFVSSCCNPIIYGLLNYNFPLREVNILTGGRGQEEIGFQMTAPTLTSTPTTKPSAFNPHRVHHQHMLKQPKNKQINLDSIKSVIISPLAYEV